jgi:hypothetical protein
VDDEDDRGYSRAPELADVVGLCRSLNREQVRYLLIGGWAVILHGYVRTTKDIDLLVDTAPDNVLALKRALADLPDNAVEELREGEIETYSVVRVADEIVVDLMAQACGITWRQAVSEGTEAMTVEGVSVPVPRKELLIRMKDTVRPGDAEDVAYLRVRIAEELDPRP